jgi:ATP-dependent RNA/DNA helicase IGHMBP2
MSKGDSDQISSGVVTKVGQTSIVVSFEESLDSMELSRDDLYKIVKLANDVTYRRLKK